MSATLAATVMPDPAMPAAALQAIAAAQAEAGVAEPNPLPNPLLDEVRLGIEQLRAMSHAELQDVIAQRVALLETVLKEREQRRAAIETARMASKVLELRRERALKIRRQVDFGSALAAVASTLLIVAVMI